MIPSIVFNAKNLQNVFPVEALKASATVSRDRDVVIKNEPFEEGLYLFRRDSTIGHFYGIKTYAAPLALVKIKGILENGTVRTSPVPKILKASSSSVQYLPDGFTAMMKTLLGGDFNTSDYTFEIKATEKVEPKVSRMQVTSETIEQQFRSGRVSNAKGELIQSNDDNDTELFLAYVFSQETDRGKDNILIDIGELWDENSIDILDLEDIFLDRQDKSNENSWKHLTSELTPQERQELVEKQNISSRIQAFDEIMRDNNANFDSNK